MDGPSFCGFLRVSREPSVCSCRGRSSAAHTIMGIEDGVRVNCVCPPDQATEGQTSGQALIRVCL